jgi:large subunit ribosomal protein L32
MSTQKQRHTRARRDRARVFHQLKPKKLVECSNCQTEILPHRVCPKCGYYKGKEVINTLKKLGKKSKK